jgi:hypothetical protein
MFTIQTQVFYKEAKNSNLLNFSNYYIVAKHLLQVKGTGGCLFSFLCKKEHHLAIYPLLPFGVIQIWRVIEDRE